VRARARHGITIRGCSRSVNRRRGSTPQASSPTLLIARILSSAGDLATLDPHGLGCIAVGLQADHELLDRIADGVLARIFPVLI